MFRNKPATKAGKASGGLFARLLHDRKGATAIVVALLATGFVGAGGLAVDVGDWYSTQRALQTAADAAALGGASQYNADQSSSDAASVASSDGKLNLTGLATGGSIVSTVNVSADTVTVTASKTANLFLAGLFLGSAPTITVQSVGAILQNVPCTLCGDGPVTINSSSTVCTSSSNCPSSGGSRHNGGGYGGSGYSRSGKSGSAPTGAVVSNTSLTNNGTVSTKVFCAPDGSRSPTSGEPSECSGFNDTTSIKEGGSYNTLGGSPPAPTEGSTTTYYNGSGSGSHQVSGSGCSNSSSSGVSCKSGSVTLNPGVYCGGISATGSASITLNPGVYVMYNGPFNFTSSGTLDGSSGVTIYMTGTEGSGTVAAGTCPSGTTTTDTVTITPSSGGTATVTAPSSGSTQGVAVAVDNSGAMCNGQPMTNTVGGSGAVNVSGVAYFGSHTLNVAGSSAVNQNASYTVMRAGTVNVTNTSTVYAYAPTASSNVPAGYMLDTSTVQLVQ